MNRFFHLDSFAFEPFRGNPAGVVILDGPEWPEASTLQKLAAEINLPATAFLILGDIKTKIRWFSPSLEIQLCGHASLAAGAVLLQHLFPHKESMILESSFKGDLPIQKVGNLIQLNFPKDELEQLETIPAGIPAEWQVLSAYRGNGLYLELASHQAVQHFPYDRELVASLAPYKVIVTAKSADPHYDFVSRVFEPNLGIDEDPVTGSAHCGLTAIWAEKLGKTKFKAAQISKRMGELELELVDDRVLISGHAQLVMEGKIMIPELNAAFI